MTEAEFIFLRDLAMQCSDVVVKVNVIRMMCAIGCVLAATKNVQLNPTIQVHCDSLFLQCDLGKSNFFFLKSWHSSLMRSTKSTIEIYSIIIMGLHIFACYLRCSLLLRRRYHNKTIQMKTLKKNKRKERQDIRGE